MDRSWAALSRRVASAYATIANTLLGALLLFVAVNVLVLFIWTGRAEKFKGQREQTIDLFIRRHGIETLRAAYPGMPDDKIRDLLIATGDNSSRYYPYIEFIESPFISPEMVVRPEGYRVIGRDQAPWPPPKGEKTVFVFGSSITLGTGALSDQTIPAYIQKILRANFKETVNVYNFGTGSHYSTQEALFLFDWLRKGIRPDLAIFIDGASETAFPDDRSALSGFLENAVEQNKAATGAGSAERGDLWSRLAKAARALPVMRIVAGRQTESETAEIRTKNAGLRDLSNASELQRPATEAEVKTSETVLDRYQSTMKSATGMGAANGVETFFVWQPAPLYKYDLRFYPFELQPSHLLHRVSYPMMFRRFMAGALPKNFGWCADVQEDQEQTLYVDQMHYRPKLSQLTATCTVATMANAGTFERLGWTRRSDQLVSPDFHAENQVAASDDTLVDLNKVLEQQPGRLHASNVEVTAPEAVPSDAAGRGVRLLPVGESTEHYLTVFTELTQTGEYVLSMHLTPKGASRFRIQVWNSETDPSGVIADIQFDGEAVRATPVNAAKVSAAQVIQRGDAFDFTLQAKLPGGLARVVLQPIGPDGKTVFAPDRQSVVVQHFVIDRASS